MTRTDVQRLYTRFGGRWWQPFRTVWEFLICRGAIRDLESVLSHYGTPGVTVLDLGCGAGENLARLRRLSVPFDRYTGLDFSPHMLALARKRFAGDGRARFVEGDATRLADTGERYGLITSSWLLDHINEPAALVNSARRQLEPGGHAVFLFYTEPRRFIGSWYNPWSRWSALAEPVGEDEVQRFEGVVRRRSYSLGLSALVEIEALASDEG
jgi:ubiquinone/menaquinone biosynthesis C-methylase UbiE